MSRGAALTDALLTTLATPPTWPLALAVFLLRGGLLLVVVPIVVLPSPVGLGNLLAPALITVVLRGLSVELAIVAALVILAALAWFVVGGLAAATLEAEGARLVARAGDGSADGMPAAERDAVTQVGQGRVATRIVVARAMAHVPTGFALLWGSARLIDVAYRELTSPLDVATPIVIRVVGGAPEAIVAVLILWAIGEIVGGLAARRIALDGERTAAALRDAVAATARRPAIIAVEFLVPLMVLGLVVLPSTLAASGAWNLVRAALRSSGDAVSATLAVILFVTLWLVGLLLIAVTAAWRSAVWSVAHRDPAKRPSRRARPMGSEPA
jgi:hypothetical protein